MLTVQRVSRAVILFSENEVTKRNTIHMRADEESEEEVYEN